MCPVIGAGVIGAMVADRLSRISFAALATEIIGADPSDLSDGDAADFDPNRFDR
jgi:phosphoglycerate dehydrogenase-like enzyme